MPKSIGKMFAITMENERQEMGGFFDEHCANEEGERSMRHQFTISDPMARNHCSSKFSWSA
jgi:hypothetical protein